MGFIQKLLRKILGRPVETGPKADIRVPSSSGSTPHRLTSPAPSKSDPPIKPTPHSEQSWTVSPTPSKPQAPLLQQPEKVTPSPVKAQPSLSNPSTRSLPGQPAHNSTLPSNSPVAPAKPINRPPTKSDDTIPFRYSSPQSLNTSSDTPTASSQPVTAGDELARTGRIRPRRESVTIYVGIDFGTSFTKVVYRQGSTGQAIPMQFNHNLSWVPQYCLPSLIAFTDTRQILFGGRAADHLSSRSLDEGVSRIKILVAGNYEREYHDESAYQQFRAYTSQYAWLPAQDLPEKLATYYLCHVMGKVRRHLCKLPEYTGMDLNTIFQVCLPVDMVEKQGLFRAFKRIFLAAVNLSHEASSGIDSWRELTRIYNSMSGEESDEQARVFAIPESVAEMAAYLNSLSCQDGIHALIDIGGGTTDVSIFNLRNIGTERAQGYWYAARNLPHGTVDIERFMVKYLSERDHGSCTRQDVAQHMESIKVSRDATIANQVFQELESIWRETHPVWGAAYAHKREQNLWTGKNVQIFYSGGGSGLPHVKDIFSQSWMDNWGPYPIDSLPVPDDYSGKRDAPFHRMAVAYGLSIPQERFKDFILPSKAPDHTIRLPEKEKEYGKLIPLGVFRLR